MSEQPEKVNHGEVDLGEFFEAIGNAKVCFWFGCAPCPKCGQDHGDPKCDPKLDAALRMSWERGGEIEKLQTAIRKHRDMLGDDRCHIDDAELYAALPEGDTRPARETAVTIENCQRYIECRQQGREYVSPQRRIEELEAAIRLAMPFIDRISSNWSEDYRGDAGCAAGILAAVVPE